MSEEWSCHWPEYRTQWKLGADGGEPRQHGKEAVTTDWGHSRERPLLKWRRVRRTIHWVSISKPLLPVASATLPRRCEPESPNHQPSLSSRSLPTSNETLLRRTPRTQLGRHRGSVSHMGRWHAALGHRHVCRSARPVCRQKGRCSAASRFPMRSLLFCQPKIPSRAR